MNIVDMNYLCSQGYLDNNRYINVFNMKKDIMKMKGVRRHSRGRTPLIECFDHLI